MTIVIMKYPLVKMLSLTVVLLIVFADLLKKDLNCCYYFINNIFLSVKMPEKPNPCGICCKNISNHCKSVFCNHCNFWVHIKCNNISVSEYVQLQNEPDDVPWFCKKCTMDMFPFGLLTNEEFLGLCDFDLPSLIDSAPSFEITSNLTNLPNLSDYDIDEHTVCLRILTLATLLYLNFPPYSYLQVTFLFFIQILEAYPFITMNWSPYQLIPI